MNIICISLFNLNSGLVRETQAKREWNQRTAFAGSD